MTSCFIYDKYHIYMLLCKVILKYLQDFFTLCDNFIYFFGNVVKKELIIYIRQFKCQFYFSL